MKWTMSRVSAHQLQAPLRERDAAERRVGVLRRFGVEVERGGCARRPRAAARERGEHAGEREAAERGDRCITSSSRPSFGGRLRGAVFVVHAAQQRVQRVVAARAQLARRAVALERRHVERQTCARALRSACRAARAARWPRRARAASSAISAASSGWPPRRGASASIERGGTGSAVPPSWRRSRSTCCAVLVALRAQRRRGPSGARRRRSILGEAEVHRARGCRRRRAASAARRSAPGSLPRDPAVDRARARGGLGGGPHELEVVALAALPLERGGERRPELCDRTGRSAAPRGSGGSPTSTSSGVGCCGVDAGRSRPRRARPRAPRSTPSRARPPRSRSVA